MWEEKLFELEKKENWRSALDLLERVIKEHDDEPMPYIRIIYLLHHLLLETDFRSLGFDHDELANSLLNYFQVSRDKFGENPKYLFYVGTLMHIAEWYFGEDDTDAAYATQRKATELEPDNPLYVNYCKIGLPETSEEERQTLAAQLLENQAIVDELESKGMPESYILGGLKFWAYPPV